MTAQEAIKHCTEELQRATEQTEELIQRVKQLSKETAETAAAAEERIKELEKKCQKNTWDKVENWVCSSTGEPVYLVGYIYVCGACGYESSMASNFCPHCGADMREEKNE